MTKSRLRTLHLDGDRYTWKADIQTVDRRRVIRVRVWGEPGKNGLALQADLVERPGRESPDADADAYPFPGAEDVRALVRQGLAEGWAPDQRGGTFVLAQVELPDFVLRS